MDKQRGLTLVEVIIYVAILSLATTSFMTMYLNIFALKSKSIAQQEVTANLRLISQKINYEIRNAKSIASTTASSLTLVSADSSRNPTIFSLSNGNINFGFGSGGSCPATNPCILNSNLVNISGFTITNLSSGDSKTQNIDYTVAGNYINNSGLVNFNASGAVSDSAEVRSR